MAHLQPQTMAKQPSDAGRNVRKAGLGRNEACPLAGVCRYQTSTAPHLVARIDAMRNATDATETTPAPPVRDQNKMLPPDHAPTCPLLRVEPLALLRGSIRSVKAREQSFENELHSCLWPDVQRCVQMPRVKEMHCTFDCCCGGGGFTARELDVTKKSFQKEREDNFPKIKDVRKIKKVKNYFLKMLQKQ
jgi:hypothetical protein